MPKIPFSLSQDIKGPNLPVARVFPMSTATGGLQGRAIQEAAETALAVVEKKVQILEAEAAAKAMTDTQAALMEARIEFEKDPSKIAEYNAKVQEIGKNSTKGLPRKAAAAVQASVGPMIIREMGWGNNRHTEYMVENSALEFEKNRITSGVTVATDYTNIAIYNQEVARLTGALVARHQAYGPGHYPKAQLELDIINTQNYLSIQRASAHALQDPLDFLEKSAGAEGRKWMKKNYPTVDAAQTGSLRGKASAEASRLKEYGDAAETEGKVIREASEAVAIGKAAEQGAELRHFEALIREAYANNDITEAKFNELIAYIKNPKTSQVVTDENLGDIARLGDLVKDVLDRSGLVAAQKMVYTQMVEQEIPWELVQPLLGELAAQSKGNRTNHFKKVLLTEITDGVVSGLSGDPGQNTRTFNNLKEEASRLFMVEINEKGSTPREAYEKIAKVFPTLSSTERYYDKSKNRKLHSNPQVDALLKAEDPIGLLDLLEAVEATPKGKRKPLSDFEIEEAYTQLDEMNAKQIELEPLEVQQERMVKDLTEARRQAVEMGDKGQLEEDLRSRRATTERHPLSPMRWLENALDLVSGEAKRVRKFRDLPEEIKQEVLGSFGLEGGPVGGIRPGLQGLHGDALYLPEELVFLGKFFDFLIPDFIAGQGMVPIEDLSPEERARLKNKPNLFTDEPIFEEE